MQTARGGVREAEKAGGKGGLSCALLWGGAVGRLPFDPLNKRTTTTTQQQQQRQQQRQQRLFLVSFLSLLFLTLINFSHFKWVKGNSDWTSKADDNAAVLRRCQTWLQDMTHTHTPTHKLQLFINIFTYMQINAKLKARA